MLVTVLVCAAIAVVVGLIGVVVPILPGSLLIAAGIGGWAFFVPSWPARILCIVAVIVLAIAAVAQYIIAGRHMQKAGVPRRSMLIGGVIGVVGFFVIPVVGLPLGFTVGVWLSEAARLSPGKAAWNSTLAALKAIAITVGIELAGGLIAAALWGISVLVAWPHIHSAL